MLLNYTDSFEKYSFFDLHLIHCAVFIIPLKIDLWQTNIISTNITVGKKNSVFSQITNKMKD